MTYEEALQEIPNIDSFCRYVCNCGCGHEDYCPTECSLLEKARQLDFDRIVKCYARHEGDLEKVFRYIKCTKVIRNRGGY